MTKRGLPSSSIWGNGGGAGPWNQRGIVPFLPLASTTNRCRCPLRGLEHLVLANAECLMSPDVSSTALEFNFMGSRIRGFRDIPTSISLSSSSAFSSSSSSSVYWVCLVLVRANLEKLLLPPFFAAPPSAVKPCERLSLSLSLRLNPTMAVTAILRTLLLSPRHSSLSSLSLLRPLFATAHLLPSVSSSHLNFKSPSNPTNIFALKSPTKPTLISPISRPFSISIHDKPNTKVNFSPPNSDSDSEPEPEPTQALDVPPPYDPFSKKPVIEEPEDPKNLQEVFHKMRTEGLFNNAVKMFDEMSKDGLTHEALELFREIKDKGQMPDVVAHTAVIEAYANAGQIKEAHRVYLRMLASGVAPNAYTYGVLIKSLAGDGKLGEVKKYVLEMMGKGMIPNCRVCVAVFEAFVREGKVEEGRELLSEMKKKGFVVDERGFREALKGKRGQIARTVMDVLFAK
ncbi:hypothetical protein Cgig2_018194 [Carnegiea gigantea]|uniref:Pentatricopeptide repeat-containing protein n=1 Tax=Carnegiea gigantea TaxID=171969 RepID=A0A9Q1QTB7_9CARY|nr:hypothetical protein Cgig2_018194 [Carnegiea gigantea]